MRTFGKWSTKHSRLHDHKTGTGKSSQNSFQFLDTIFATEPFRDLLDIRGLAILNNRPVQCRIYRAKSQLAKKPRSSCLCCRRFCFDTGLSITTARLGPAPMAVTIRFVCGLSFLVWRRGVRKNSSLPIIAVRLLLFNDTIFVSS
jgi:hypothetical protein